MAVEEATGMGSLFEELEVREAAARVRLEELPAAVVELTLRLVKVREDLSRLEITRETVAQVLAELSAPKAEEDAVAEDAHADRPDIPGAR
ncbi:hypothetical protein ABZS88_00165 [Streptomyces sp. NPDC005480]|uniref:hypothetical protein n=1 Tax=Streptomyces sp. NPDC005480 TaxID=3154880 RepID=UPI00339EFEDF